MKEVLKGWGREEIWADEIDYCGKLLIFHAGGTCSMHFHRAKDETWLVQSGLFKVEWIDTKTAKLHSRHLRPGETWRNPPLLPHRLCCEEPGTIIEVSTYDDPDDNYRVMRGDSQI